MYTYVAYGLGIHSCLPLPELVRAAARADLVVRLGSVGDIPPEARGQEIYVSRAGQTGLVVAREAGAFLVRDGREIVVAPAPRAQRRVVRLYLLGPVLALALRQRGRLILHASAIAMDGGAVAFVGGSGFGKSTTAAAFHADGHRVVADDMLSVVTDGDAPVVFPGFPRLKLWPDAAAHLGEDVDALPKLHPRMPKRGRRVLRGFSSEPLPLRRIYVLAEGERLATEPLSPQAALMALVPHTALVHPLGDDDARACFLACGRIVERVPVRRLLRPPSLDTLPGMLRLVAEDLRSP
jgi:hypothetical protein